MEDGTPKGVGAERNEFYKIGKAHRGKNLIELEGGGNRE